MTQSEQGALVGDALDGLSQQYSERMNGCEFGTTLRGGSLPRGRYLGYIAGMYPIVVGFNRALIRSLAKVDHVRQHAFVRALAQQLHEEQAHNQLWRGKLRAFGVDHERLYQTLLNYLGSFSDQQLREMTLGVLECLRHDLGAVSPGCFPDAPFPEPVLALYHHLRMTASESGVPHWEHFASQASIEYIIFNVVSTSIYPGVVGNPELDAGPETTIWWKEHARQGGDGRRRTDEEKHLAISRHALNRSDEANATAPRIMARADDAMRLFAATFMVHDIDKVSFSSIPYQIGGSSESRYCAA